MPKFEIYESSPIALAKCERQEQPIPIDNTRNHKYPYAKLAIGQSFILPVGKIDEIAIRTNTSNHNRIGKGKRFIVVKHKELDIFEVARVR